MVTIQELLKESLFVTLYVCGPVIFFILVVGIMVSLLQALTQLQEPGLLFVSKLTVTLFCLFAFSSVMTSHLIRFAEVIFNYVGKLQLYT